MEIKLKKYDAYKNSGVEWLGEIPESWEVRRIKYLFKEINQRSDDGNEELLSVSHYTGVTKRSDRIDDGDLLTNASTLEGYKKVTNGDLVINIMLAWNGSLGFSSFDGITSPAYSIYRLSGNNSRNFFHYLFRTDLYKSEFKRNSSGVIESRLRLYSDDFFRIPSILPPINEQIAIAKFLDDKTTKIGQAISIKQKQIDLLKERRQILIHKAVTQGINPNVKLKDSGVEWIGEIPEHWEVKALKHIARLQSGETISAEKFVEEGYPVFGANGFRGFASNFTNKGDFVLIGRQGALCGNVNYASGEFFASEHAIVVYPQKNENIIWLGEFIRIADFNRLSQSAAQPGIAVNVIKNEIFAYPPLKEQKVIANYITILGAKISTAISLKEKEIEKLKEYKSSLINSVVTGKVRVN